LNVNLWYNGCCGKQFASARVMASATIK